MWIRCFQGGATVGECDEDAVVAYTRTTRRIVGVGEAASKWHHAPEVEVARLFSHPRLAVENVDPTLVLLRHLMHRARGSGRRGVLPRWRHPLDVLFHFEEGIAGGLTDVEKRALAHVAAQIGARSWAACEVAGSLSDGELRDLLLAADAVA